MDSIIESIEEWLRGLLVSGIMNNLNNTFNSVNTQVGEIATEVGTTPASFSPAVFNMIKNLSENVIMPIAGILLTFIACYELIQLVISHNNLANFETWIFWKWIFKTFVAVTVITNTMNITMAVFDVAQHVISNAGALILRCLKENLYPSWDAQNINSVHLAEKLGYEFDHEYIAYEVDRT